MVETHAVLSALRGRLSAAPAPDAARVHLLRLLSAGLGGDLPGQPAAVVDRVLHVLSFGVYLTEHLARNPESYALLLDDEGLSSLPTVPQLRAHARVAKTLDELRRVHRDQVLRVAAADLGGLRSLPEVIDQLSRLADVVLDRCLELVAPGGDAGGLAVLALGKLGGNELNYSSDVDLVFLAEDPAQVEAATLAAGALARGLTGYSAQGFLYRVDVRLRPWGSAGPLVVSSDRFVDYLQRQAHAWERQAMLRARPAAGDVDAGARVLARIAPLLVRDSAGVRRRIRDVKDRIEAQHVRRAVTHVKLGPGGIRDVEFLVQALQIEVGAQHPEVLTGNTLDGIGRLLALGRLGTDEAAVLSASYGFLRNVEHRLQLVDNLQVHTLPVQPRAMSMVSRSLGYPDWDAFRAQFNAVASGVRERFEAHLPRRTGGMRV